jgi:hypothetical protein
MKIEVSKLDAARRQLETAIRLFFYDVDFVSTHTLAAAAFNVLNDLSRKPGHARKSTQDQLLDHIKDEKSKKWFLNEVRKTENFLKHADRDADRIHTFNPADTSLLLIDAVGCYWNLTAEHTVLMQAYYVWFIATYPRIFIIPEEYREMLTLGSTMMAGVPKSTFLEAAIRLLTRRGMT